MSFVRRPFRSSIFLITRSITHLSCPPTRILSSCTLSLSIVCHFFRLTQSDNPKHGHLLFHPACPFRLFHYRFFDPHLFLPSCFQCSCCDCCQILQKKLFSSLSYQHPNISYGVKLGSCVGLPVTCVHTAAARKMLLFFYARPPPLSGLPISLSLLECVFAKCARVPKPRVFVCVGSVRIDRSSLQHRGVFDVLSPASSMSHQHTTRT